MQGVHCEVSITQMPLSQRAKGVKKKEHSHAASAQKVCWQKVLQAAEA